MPRVVKTNSAKQIGLSSRPISPRTRTGRDETSRICAAQRARILNAAARVVTEHGYSGMTVARVTSRAGMSRRTFYDLFEDREDCFLAVFDDAIARTIRNAGPAYEETRGGWTEQVRAGLGALLGFFDDRPGLGSLLVVDALAAGPRVLARRAQALEGLAEVIDRGRGAKGGRKTMAAEPPPLTAEGVVGGVFAVVHARLLEDGHGRLQGLLNPLMGTIVHPYLGRAAAAKELARPTPKAPPRASPADSANNGNDPLESLDMRLTYRTLLVLGAIAAQPGQSNRRIAERAGVHDQGQISKLLARLTRLGLIHNDGRGQTKGEANAWTLTTKGRQVEQATRAGTGP
jgi:AcrR family transcriptional regulator